MDAFRRILRSRKFQTSVAGIVGAVLVVLFEVDYTEEILTLIGVLTTTLVGGQTVLDARAPGGAPSDRAE